jgi:hypothetical protein
VLTLLEDAKAGRPTGGPAVSRSPLSPSAAASLHSAIMVRSAAAAAHRALRSWRRGRGARALPREAPRRVELSRGGHTTAGAAPACRPPCGAVQLPPEGWVSAALTGPRAAQPPLSPQKGGGFRHNPLLDAGSPPMSPRSRGAGLPSSAAATAKHRAAIPQFYFAQARRAALRMCRPPCARS